MLISSSHHSGGGGASGKAAAIYLVQKTDSKGVVRAEVKTLDGDPHLVGKIADSLDFKHKYSSGVIAWSPEDQPTEKEIREVLQDYKNMAFAGMNEDRFAFCAVLHRDDDKGVHVHTLTARVDLQTGKSYNPVPPGQRLQFNEIGKKWNYEKGWARPDDPNRARKYKDSDHEQKADAQAIRLGEMPKETAKKFLGELVEAEIERGNIKNRVDVVNFLSDYGEIKRQGKDYITIENDGLKFRLKGGFYGERFEVPARDQDQTRGSRVGDLKYSKRESEQAIERINRIHAGRAKYNEGRYGENKRSELVLSPSFGRPECQNPQVQKKDDALTIESVDHNNDGNNIEFEPERGRVLALDKSLFYSNRGTANRDIETRKDSGVYGEIQADREGREVATGRDGRYNFQERDEWPDDRNTGEGQEAVLLLESKIKKEKQGLENDRIRDSFVRAIERADIANCELERASRGLGGASKGLEEAVGKTGRNFEKITENLKRNMINCTDEIERFKTEINISEYLADQGFEWDRKASCPAYCVMRKDDKKYVIRTEIDSHRVYIDAHNKGDCGSVIDACQNLTGKNLGQVRKELRPYIGSDHQPPQHNEYQKVITRTEPDFLKVLDDWNEGMEPFETGYLEDRGISPYTISIYKDSIRQTNMGTFLFCHKSINAPKISGYEYKNQGYAGFSKGGQKGLCLFRNTSDPSKVKKMVITETAIDALSYAEIDDRREDTVYVSIGGNPSGEQVLQIMHTVKKLKCEVVHAYDNDRGGNQIYKAISEHVPGQRSLPKMKDWNEDLQEQVRVERVAEEKEVKRAQRTNRNESKGLER